MGAPDAARKPERGTCEFKEWMRHVGMSWDHVDDLKLVSQANNGACCIMTEGKLARGQTLCVIPKSALLSVHNSKLAGCLEAERVGGGLALAVAVMREHLLGTDSKWCAA